MLWLRVPDTLQCTCWVAVHPLGRNAPDRKGCIAYRSGALPTRTTARERATVPACRPGASRRSRLECESVLKEVGRAMRLTSVGRVMAAGRGEVPRASVHHRMFACRPLVA